MSLNSIRAFDIFCGAGGSSCGAQQAGVQVVGGVDLWDRAAETFQLNFPQAKIYPRRLNRHLAARRVAQEVGPVELLLASPECTNHSVAKGSRTRDEESRRTAFEIFRFAKAWKPRWVVVENVVSMQCWDAYGDWLSRLQALGYYTRELKLNAEQFGVPQSRRRLYIVADAEREPVVPRPRRRKLVPVSKVLMKHSSKNEYNYELRPLDVSTRARPTLERAERAITTIGPDEQFLLVYYGSDAAGGWQTVDRPLRTITTLDRFALVVPNGKGHNMRMLQPPELSAAMGFPKRYQWPQMTRREHIKLIGNAVSPPVMKAIVRALVS